MSQATKSFNFLGTLTSEPRRLEAAQAQSGRGPRSSCYQGSDNPGPADSELQSFQWPAATIKLRSNPEVIRDNNLKHSQAEGGMWKIITPRLRLCNNLNPSAKKLTRVNERQRFQVCVFGFSVVDSTQELDAEDQHDDILCE